MKTKDEQKYHALLQAALEQIFDVGLSGLTIAQVVKRAGLATGTFYVYFKGKEDLLLTLYRTTKARSLAYLLKEHEQSQPFRISFQGIIMRYIEYRIEHQKECVFFEQFMRSPFYEKVPDESVVEMNRPLEEILARGKAEQILKPYDDEILLSVILGVVKEMIHLHFTHGYAINADTKKQIVTLCWDSIKM